MSLPRVDIGNTQPIEKKVVHPDGMLDVVEIWPTIQGEGPFAGRPATFIRLAGCNMQCVACDTDYTSKRALYSVDAIVAEVERYRVRNFDLPKDPLVVITGGEPFRQQCGPLTYALIQKQYDVQFETNGTIWDDSLNGNVMIPRVKIVCSPKAAKVDVRLESRITAYKYVIQAGQVDLVDGLPTDVLHSGVRPARPPRFFYGPIYLQPCDDGDPEKNKANTEATVASCLKFGYTLCIQIHKVVGLP